MGQPLGAGWVEDRPLHHHPFQGEETWLAGSPSSLGRRDRGAVSRTRSSLRRPNQGLALAPPQRCPLGYMPRGGAAAAPPAGQTAAGTRPDAACLCVPARPPPSAVGLGRLLRDPPEDCRSDGGSSNGGGSSSAGDPGGAESNSSPRAPERETPEPGDAEGPGGHLAAKQRPVARSKIKVQCRLCPRRPLHHALASGSQGQRPSLPCPPAHPGTDAPSAPAARFLHLPLGRRQGASARPYAGWGASRLRRCAPGAGFPGRHSPLDSFWNCLKDSGAACSFQQPVLCAMIKE